MWQNNSLKYTKHWKLGQLLWFLLWWKWFSNPWHHEMKTVQQSKRPLHRTWKNRSWSSEVPPQSPVDPLNPGLILCLLLMKNCKTLQGSCHRNPAAWLCAHYVLSDFMIAHLINNFVFSNMYINYLPYILVQYISVNMIKQENKRKKISISLLWSFKQRTQKHSWHFIIYILNICHCSWGVKQCHGHPHKSYPPPFKNEKRNGRVICRGFQKNMNRLFPIPGHWEQSWFIQLSRLVDDSRLSMLILSCGGWQMKSSSPCC